ncbi:MAG TPA: hypothetical protein VF765_31080 [Polyangiaceae bacterium]
MTGATVNGQRAISVRLVTPWRGAWFADVDLDPETKLLIPSGRVVLTIGSTILTGTVDPRAAGRFGSSAHLRIVGGAGGWDKNVSAQHFHNDAGVPSSIVYTATAALVGEVVVATTPALFGPDFVRSAGPASRVFGDVDWYVDALGVTHVGARLPAIPDATLEVLSYDAIAQRLDVSCDALVVPGTSFTDDRFDGTLIARDVEQTFTTEGSRATVWCSSGAVSRLRAALSNFAREAVSLKYLRTYEYRFVLPVAGRLALQAVDASLGLPDVNPVSVTAGMAGLSCKPKPAQSVFVGFTAGDPTKPVVRAFDGTLPLEGTFDASVALHLAPTAPAVDIGQTAATVAIGPVPLPLASGPAAAAALGAIDVCLAAIAASLATEGPISIDPAFTAFATTAGTAIGVATAAIAAAMTALQTTVVKGT